jgi:hypothetical protein
MREKMRRKWWLFLLAPPALVLFGWIFGEIVMHLWNWLLPPLFGWHAITFWQGLGLLVLCRILFGGWGGGGGSKSRRRREDWQKLTPEEREKLRQDWRSRCGGFGAAASEVKGPA